MNYFTKLIRFSHNLLQTNLEHTYSIWMIRLTRMLVTVARHLLYNSCLRWHTELYSSQSFEHGSHRVKFWGTKSNKTIYKSVPIQIKFRQQSPNFVDFRWRWNCNIVLEKKKKFTFPYIIRKVWINFMTKIVKLMYIYIAYYGFIFYSGHH